MQNDMRDRLVELIKEASYYLDEQDVVCNRVADHLIANGVVLPPLPKPPIDLKGVE